MSSLGNFSFGSNANPAVAGSSTTALNLSTNAAGNKGGFAFGGGTNQTSTPASTGLGLGGGFAFAPSSATTMIPNPLLGGSSATVATVNPLLGGITNTAASVGGFSFGAGKVVGTAAPMSAVLNTTPSAAPSLFGAGATAAGTSGFGLSSAIKAPTAIAATLGGGITGGFGGGIVATTTTIAAVASATTPFSFGGLGSNTQVTTSNTTFTGLGGTSTPSIGLGGVQPPTTNTVGDVAGVKLEGKPSKETPLPQEIFATIAAFESFKNEEKTASEANLRQNATAFHKLGDDCKKLRCYVTELATLHDSLQHKVNAIKDKIITESDNIEMARHTQNTPVHLQGDNTAPEQYFNNAMSKFESHMVVCRDRIEEVEKCLSVSNYSQYDESALRELVRRQHEDLQLAASHVYKLHTKLIQLSNILPCADDIKPKPLFKAGAGDLSQLDDDATRSSVPKESSVIRSCFDLPGGESRLGTFQMNMAKARAMSINPAPPPTQPLQSTPSLFGTSFNTGSTFGIPNTTNTFNTSGGFGGLNTTNTFGNTSAFSNNNFGSPNVNTSNQAGSLFSSTFGQNNKLFKT